ncbi:hypothetical protein GGI25_003911 [Coemansia spiralis]|uniref:Glutaredoxin domain-containing protein n=2 Tax=Coemansia TaxID=4863 RepID=A0A9W8KW41_9FUNG|nr:hypothetical protein EDC05_003642 [Coemansia umbellata]KAJ2621146.1 hypothetical protein GGI26_004409 [Coemansia sp. RSA 1358]KAJ2675713.1 hypothetical protein GGI25_003911 [Coemansia spiralis]
MSRYRHPSAALRKIISKPDPGPIWNRSTPTALEYVVTLINSSPLFLFSRHNCPHSRQLGHALKAAELEFRLVYLDDIPTRLGNAMQRRLCDLTGQWTVPHLFVKSQSIGGLQTAQEALKYGKINSILQSNEWIELVYSVRSDALARDAKIKQKSPMSFAMGLQDSHRFSYVHRERWAKIKRYVGEEPEIEDFPLKHKILERPSSIKGQEW